MITNTHARGQLRAAGKRLSFLTAGAVALSTMLGAAPLYEPKASAASSPAVQLEADYGVPDGTLIRTEQFNNTNYSPLPVHIVDELRGIKTKVVRDFVKINWYYNKDPKNPDLLAYSIDTPENLATNPDLQHGRKETYDFMGQFSESLMISLAYSYGGASNPAKNRLIAGETEMNWEEYDRAMRRILLTLKEKNPKLEYIEVGNEPNLEPAFYGHELNRMEHTAEKPGYMRMYEGMSKAVLWVNEQLSLDDTFQDGKGKRMKVGGPVLSGYDFAKQKEFVDLAYANGYHVDFVSWHRYRTQVSENETQEREMKAYLRQFYPEAITVVSEYGWKGGGGLSDSTDAAALAKQAAFMTDSAYFYEKGGTDIPMNWVAVHTLNAYFKNQFDVDYALSSGNPSVPQRFESGYTGPVQYMNLRGWRESATSGLMKIKEVRLYDENDAPIPIPNDAADPAIAAVTDGNPETFFLQSDYWSWLRFDLGEAKRVKRIEIDWGNPEINKFQLVGTADKLHYYELLGRTYMTPYFNAMRLLARLGDEKVKTTGGRTGNTGVRLLATKNSDSKASILVWNHQLDGNALQDVDLLVSNLPEGFQGKSLRYRKYLVDAKHSNYAFNKRDALEIVEEGTMNVTGRERFLQTLEPNAVMLIELEAVDGSIRNRVSAGKAVSLAAGDLTNLPALVDGDPSTKAAAASGSYPQEVVIDLGKPFRLSGAEIEWTEAYTAGYTYTLSTSLTAGGPFAPAAGGADASGNALHWFDGHPKARYVKLSVTGSTAAAPLSIDGVSVFADALYANGFGTPEEAAELADWQDGEAGGSLWTTARDTVTGDAYAAPKAPGGESPVFAILPPDQLAAVRDVGIEARVKLAAGAADAEAGLLVRAADESRHYAFALERVGGDVRASLVRRTAGAADATLASTRLPSEVAASDWATLRLEAVGDTLVGYVNGEQAFSVGDADARAPDSGRAGLWTRLAGGMFADVNLYPIPPLLGELSVNGVPVADFSPHLHRYLVKLPASGSDPATVAASVYGGAHAVVHPAASQRIELGATGDEKTVIVSAASLDGYGSTHYALTLAKASEDATLSSLKLSVIPAGGTYDPSVLPDSDLLLTPGVYDYQLTVASRTRYVSVVEATPTASNLATTDITNAFLADGRGTITVKVTAEAGNSQTYTVHVAANTEPAKGAELYAETFENGMFNQDPVTGWKKDGAVDTANLRVVAEPDGYVLEKHTTSNMAHTVGSGAWTNYEVRARVKPVTSPSLPGIIARASDDGKDFYMLRIHDGENGLAGGSRGYIALGRVVNGSLKELSLKKPFPYTPGKWVQLRLAVQGSRIVGYADDKLMFDVVDDGTLFGAPALTQGKAGIRIANQAARIDDFAVYALETTVVDTVKPVITLIGDAAVAIPQGAVYVDAGATAADDVDGDLTASVEAEGSVDTSVPGLYTIRYRVRDAAGNNADEVVRTVQVVAAGGGTKPFAVTADGPLNREGGLTVRVMVDRAPFGSDHPGTEVVFFQLVRGDTPISHAALTADIASGTPLSAHFAAAEPSDPAYAIRVFVVDDLPLSGGPLPTPLSEKLIVE